jgi:hypothetical protein
MSQACKHLMQLYKEVKNLKEAHKAVNLARSEVTGRGNDDSQKRLNPLVLWFIVSESCWHRILKLAFREPGDICESTHCGWCCESCALAGGVDPTTPIAPGITMGDTLSYIRKESKTGKIKLRKKARSPVPVNIKKHRRGGISDERKAVLTEKLKSWRTRRFNEHKHKFPASICSFVFLPDEMISKIVKNVENIVTMEQLVKCFQDAKFDLSSSFLSLAIVQRLLHKIDSVLEENNDKGNVNKGYAAVKVSLICRTNFFHSSGWWSESHD